MSLRPRPWHHDFVLIVTLNDREYTWHVLFLCTSVEMIAEVLGGLQKRGCTQMLGYGICTL